MAVTRPIEIVDEITRALELQAAALAAGDVARLDELAGRISALNDELLLAAEGMDAAGRGAVAERLRRVIEQASELCHAAELRREATRQEIRDLRTGQFATAAYRQALPREATLHYSRQG